MDGLPQRWVARRAQKSLRKRASRIDRVVFIDSSGKENTW